MLATRRKRPAFPLAPVRLSIDMRSEDIRQRALRGVLMLVGRGAILRLIGLVGTIGLARLLSPRELGILALGWAVLGIGDVFVNGGIAAGLIRGRQEPRRKQLAGVLGFQVAVGLGLTAVAAGLAVAIDSTVATVIALFVAGLPIAALRTAGAVVTERRLDYRPILWVDIAETLGYFGLAVGMAALGAGVVGVAAMAIVRAVLGTAVMLALVPDGRIVPRHDFREARQVLAFGIRFQLTAIVSTGRNQGLNTGVGAIGGLAVLGVWDVAFKVLQAPFVLLESMWRVSYPAVARLLDAGEDLREALVRSTRRIGVAVGGLLAGLVASAPGFVPLLFGPEFSEAADAIPWACLGLAVSAPVSVVSSGFLFAKGDAGAVLRALVFNAVVWLAVAFALVGPLGVAGVGIGWMCGSLAEAAVFTMAVRRHVGVSPIAVALGPATVAAFAGAAGLAAAGAVDGDALEGGVGLAVALAAYLAAMLLVGRDGLVDTYRLGRQALQGATT